MTSLAGICTWNSFITALALSMASYILEVSLREFYLEGNMEQKQNLCSEKYLGCHIMDKSHMETSLITLAGGRGNCMNTGLPRNPRLN